MCNNPDVDLVNMIAYIKFGAILSINFALKILYRNKIWRE